METYIVRCVYKCVVTFQEYIAVQDILKAERNQITDVYLQTLCVSEHLYYKNEMTITE